MAEYLTIGSEPPKLKNATMLLALTGWMDGGLVSTGTVRHLMSVREVKEIGRIDPDPFYIYNFPGSMEVASIFRPTVKHENGLITEWEPPTNIFHCDAESNLVFFIGQEPNLRWQSFADCIFEMAKKVGVKRIIFMGSFGGSVPHTRDPRMYGSVSHEHLKQILTDYGVRLSDYEGPAGFSSLLLAQSPDRKMEMLSIVAEIPGYLQGMNPLSIEAVARRLGRLINQPVDLDMLRSASNEWEAQVTEAVAKDSKLAATVRKLEEKYDNQLIGTEEPEGESPEEEEFEESADDEQEEEE